MAEPKSIEEKNEFQEICSFQDYIIEAPVSIALLGQIMLVSTHKDFSLITKPLANSDEEYSFSKKSHFKHISHPESFRAALLQVYNAGFRAFLGAHSNMDKVMLSCDHIGDHIDIITECITKGDNSDIQMFVPISLESLSATANECKDWSREIKEGFYNALQLLEEIDVACQITQKTNEDRIKEFEKHKAEVDEEKELIERKKKEREKNIEEIEEERIRREKWLKKMENIENKKETEMNDFYELSEKIRAANMKLLSNKVEKVDLEDIQKIIGEVITQLSQLEKRWTLLEAYFIKVANTLELAMEESIKFFSESTIKVLESQQPITPFKKKIILALSLQTYTQCYIASSISTSYMKISRKYLMPSIVKLGTLLTLNPADEKDKLEIKKRSDEIRSTSLRAIGYIQGVVESENEQIDKKIEQKTKEIEHKRTELKKK